MLNWICFYINKSGSMLTLLIVMTIHCKICISGRGLVYTMIQIHKIGTRHQGFQNTYANEYLSTSKICKRVLKNQKPLCEEHFPLMPSVISGFMLGINECQFQFANHVWNCQGHNKTNNQQISLLQMSNTYIQKKPKRDRKLRNTYMDQLIAKSTPESAFILSIISAGVSYQVTKACSQGVHSNCGCDRTVYDAPKDSKFTWSGCSHNIHFGAAFSRRFLDAREKIRLKKQTSAALTNMHNNHVGRESVINKMIVKCKCHGVSGSCEMRTCSRNLPSFRVVGDQLKERFRKIIQVDFFDNKLIPKYPSKEMFAEVDMLYLNDSPDHCHHDFGKGTLGTNGRICNDTYNNTYQEPENSCYRLCCQRGYHIKTYIKDEQCHCKFKWCCKVICETCKRKVIDAICN
uniref:Protein Wnt n=1 Tax=Schmidtea mediterranea TaxID=79327 RepID=B0LMF7_SCHMD|nr:wntP-2 [Schmidtea mediterranea]